MPAFTLVFIAALALAILTRLWLAQRQIASVAAHRDRVPDAFAEQIDLASHRKAADYTVAKTGVHRLEVLVSTALLLTFTLGGGLQGLYDFWARWLEPSGYAHGIALIGSVILISAVIDLPFALYRVFNIEARFGFNRMTPWLFFSDLMKQTALGIALGLPLLLLVLWLMDRMGEAWWLYVWAVWMGFNLLLLWLYPTLIAPLFNRFTPLEDAGLRGRIEALLTRCGFTSKGLFVMDGSKRSSHGNAYFTGFGSAKRIVFFDTLITRLEPQEVEAVLAHELGHFKRRHVVKRVALLAVLSLASLYLLALVAQQDWFYEGLGVSGRSTAMALLLFFLVVPVFTFLVQPLLNAYSRKHEYEADAYAAGQADAGDLIRALVKLYQDNAATLTPDRLHSDFYDSHPPAGLRIARLQAS